MSNAVPVITLADETISSKSSPNPVTLITLDDVDESKPSSISTPVITLDGCESKASVEPAKTEGKRTNESEAWSGKKSFSEMHVGLTEEDVGISQFVSSLPGFNAVIKQRYSDFQVNEIDLEGAVAKLTSLAVPEEKVEEEPAPVDKAEILSVISQEDLTSIEEMIASKDKSSRVLLNVTSLSKEERKKIHKLLKSLFKSSVYSNTVDKENEKFIQVGLSSKIDDRWNRQKWDSGEYLHFIVHKENMDHSQTVNLLSHLLRMKPNLITAAGTKDKRAKTTQWMSIRKVKANRIANMRLRNIWFGHYCYKKDPLRLGDLKGNQFRIALRNISADDNTIEEAVESVRQRGFINYFGLQRFGSSVVAPTHIIGKTLLQCKWKEAVEMILKPRPGEKGDHAMNSVRDTWWSTRDPKKALRHLNVPGKSIEGKLLQALDQLGPSAYLNALEKLPRCTAMLYVHGYQSFVWNKVVSRRIEEFGLAPIAGDLVLEENVDLDIVASQQELLVEAVLDPESEVTDESRSVMDNKTHSFTDIPNVDPPLNSSNPVEVMDVAKSNADCKEKDTDQSDKSKSRKVKVKKLTKEDLQNYKMEDLIYPLPGYDVEYPDNVIKSWYEEILGGDELATDNFKQSVKLFSALGSYRKMLCVPTNLSWSIMMYKSINDNLILSDIEELKGLPAPKNEEDGSFKGITVKMCLPSCSYATMCLREITKSSTSVSHQASLTAKSMETAVQA